MIIATTTTENDYYVMATTTSNVAHYREFCHLLVQFTRDNQPKPTAEQPPKTRTAQRYIDRDWPVISLEPYGSPGGGIIDASPRPVQRASGYG